MTQEIKTSPVSLQERARQQFESWCVNEMNINPENLERLAGGQGAYKSDSTEARNVNLWWMGWKAAASLAPSIEPSPVCQKCADLEERLLQANKLYELALQNEMRWMKKAAPEIGKFGPLLDAWDQLPNDILTLDELEPVRKKIAALREGIEPTK